MSNQLQKEILGIRLSAEKEAIQSQKKLMLAYRKSMDNIQGEIGKIYAKQSVDGVLSVSNKQRLAILKSLDNQLKTMYSELGKLDQQITLDILMKSYESAYYKTIYTIDKGLSTAISFDLLNPKIIEKAVNVKFKGTTFSDRIWKNKKLMISRLKNNVNRAIIEGKSIDKLARDIKKTFGTTAYESKRLMQNEVKNVMTNAQQKIYEDSPVVSRIMWSATLDDRTRDEHQDLDGQTWSTDESHPSPSDFVMCRCSLVPVVAEWNPSKRIDNETKEVIQYTTYNEWKASKSID
jgi:SPP1 gp7 family putative phage head morphogenesis protein